MKTKCKNCGGKVTYNPEAQQLVCEHCGSITAINGETIGNAKRPYNFSVSLKEQKATVFHCDSCGSNLTTSGEDPITRCPNCGSKNISTTANAHFVPDAILPFSISKQKASEAFHQFIKKGHFRPNDFARMARQEKLSATYVPVYNFSAHTHTTYQGVGITESRDSENNIITHRHPFSGSFSNDYNDYMFSANNNFSNTLVRWLAPWELENLKVYSDDYLFGFIGSNVNINLHECFQDFTREIKNADEREARFKNSYTRYESFSSSTQISDQRYNYLYLPLYTNYYTYKQKNYACYINGRTGKVTGKTPKSFWKIFSLVAGILAGIGAIITLAICLS